MSTKAQRKARRRERQREKHKQASAQQQAQPAPPVTPLPPDEPVEAEEPSGDGGAPRDNGEKKNRKGRFSRHAFWQLVFSGSLVIFTLGQMVVGYWQWDATNKQWEVMRLDQRPWLSFDAPQIETPALEQSIIGEISIKNTGKTPARLVGFGAIPSVHVSSGGIVLKTEDIHTEFPAVNIDIARTIAILRDSVWRFDNVSFGSQRFAPEYVLIPGETLTMKIQSPSTVSHEAMQVLSDGGFVVVVVYAKYLDATQQPHESWACYAYDPVTKASRMHARHNHMD